MSTTVSDKTIEEMEKVIRDLAGAVVSFARTRRDHPSYGITKGDMRKRAAQMEGAIGMYMVLTGQARHALATALAVFRDQATTDRVEMARNTIASL